MNKSFSIPVEIVSEANQRGHWAKKHTRAKDQKGMAYAHCLKHLGCKLKDDTLPGDFVVTLTRIMRKGQRAYDGDNLQSGLKAVRDGIAKYLGIDDGSKRIQWLYSQGKGGGVRGEVRVEIVENEK